MKILLTGGSGYLGKRLVNKLLETGNEVVLLLHNDKMLKETKYNEHVKIYSCEIEDIKMAMKSNIDIVIHLATLYGRKGEDISEILQANLEFPLQVINEAIKNNVKYFFNMDTAIKKDINYYTVTKRQFKEWGKFFCEQEKIRFINMNTEHFYGPFDSDIKFVANMLKKLKNNVQYIETTAGEQKRAFLYIDDLIEAIVRMINYEKNKTSLEFVEYDVGPDKNITIKEAINTMKKVTGATTEIRFGAIPYRKNEEMESKCDNSKLKNIGWKQKTLTFEEGIRKILMEEEKNENLD